MHKNLFDWLRRNRTSVRVAFVMQVTIMVISVGLSLMWSRFLLRIMGDALNGLFIAFQSVTRLGGVGDLGVGGAVGLRAGQMLGRGDESSLRSFLANARGVFLVLSAGSALVLLVASPWLPGWLNFYGVAGVGSPPVLFIIGALSVGVLIFGSYFSNLNYGFGTTVWPIVPSFLLTQLSLATHCWLASMHLPLWVQFLPYLAASVLIVTLGKKMLDWAHPWLGELTPLRYDWSEWKPLMMSSGWVYLCGVGSVIYSTTDRLVITKAFGPAILPTYYYNYRLGELAMTVVLIAGNLSMPKITQWLASHEKPERDRALSEIDRLNVFQVFIGCGSALAYLAINGIFIRHWLGAGYNAPWAWQTAFALNFVVTASGATAISIAGRLGIGGIRTAGIAVGLSALLNLVLAIVAAAAGSIAGIAFAAVASQSILSINLGRFLCRELGFNQVRWLVRSWLVPVSCVLVAAGFKYLLPEQSFAHIGLLAVCYCALLCLTGWLIGLNWEMLRSELAIIRFIAKR